MPVRITHHHAKRGSGVPNHFHSNGGYQRPDPSKPGGLPYIERDGESNAENFFSTRTRMNPGRFFG
jgi:hypothetical protein